MSQLTIEVRDETVHHREGVSKRTGKPYRIPQQYGWVTLVTGESRRITLMLANDALPYLKGVYALAAESFGVNQWGDLELSRVRLKKA